MARPTPATIHDLVDFLAPGVQVDQLIEWPPDAFAVAASILDRTGAYLRVTDRWPPPLSSELQQVYDATWKDDEAKAPSAWHWMIALVGEEWERYVRKAHDGTQNPDAEAPLPSLLRPTLKRWWNVVFKKRTLGLDDLRLPENFDVVDALLQICAAADEACAGVGVMPGEGVGSLIDLANVELRETGPATLCRRIRPEAYLVLPKLHTPQCGATIRSVTHHLALCRGSEVTPRWLLAASEFRVGPAPRPSKSGLRSEPGLNLLVIPWPDRVAPVSFAPARQPHASYGYFDYNPVTPGTENERAAKLEKIYQAAIETVGRVDGIIMPELALCDGEMQTFSRFFLDKNHGGFFVAGVGTKPGDPAPGKNSAGKNEACFAFKIGESYQVVRQTKHHRWCLERNQIEAYGLGGMLDPVARWWENIDVDRRMLHFMPFSPSLTAAVLICEDLARQEPVSEIIRAVGPNLVIALLMDGPQLAGRWPGRYATVLADDPGCSVLSVTSIGMAQLSRPAGISPLRTVGLWKDPLNGVRHINLEPGAEGVVLSLTHDLRTEFTLDGRGDGGAANFLALNGVHSITCH